MTLGRIKSKLAREAKKVARKVAPGGSRRYQMIRGLIGKTPSLQTYEEWIKNTEPALFKDNLKKGTKQHIKFSIIVPCYNTPDKYLVPLVDSVINQTYENWQLCLADGSNDKERVRSIKGQSKRDKRITYIGVGKNLGIVGNTNEGIKHSSGEFIAFLDHDDVLSPFALSEVFKLLLAKPSTDLIYSDEDKLSDDGKTRLLPFFKPDWSPTLLLGVNYITHFVVARKTLVKRIRGLRSGFDGAQDYDFLLRLTETTNKIEHIPKILYHWRLAEGSTAKAVGEKNYADAAGQRALKDALDRRGIKAESIGIPDRPTNYRPKFMLPKKQPLVSIIIPFKDKVEFLQKCVPSILNKTTYKNYEIILVSNNSEEQQTFDYLKKLKKKPKCRIYEWNEPFNYSAVNNYGRTLAKGEYLVFLNNDTEVLTPEWLDELIGVASQESSGAVGPLLYYPNKTIQHAGVVLGMGGMAGHVFRLRLKDEWTHFGMPAWPRDYLAVTGACLAIKASKYDQVNGFDELLRVGGNDVALCLELYKAGYHNIYWPFAELVHYENISVGPYKSSVPIEDYNRSLEYYRPYLESSDKYFNPNLDIMNEYIELRR